MLRLTGPSDELVHVKEGAVWVNDERVEPPAALAGLHYAAGAEVGAFPPLGTPDHPWRLGPGQYCVLGDFSQRAADSRFWGPVPGSHIEGVVDLCYWPVSRWRAFR
jgi:type IV secretory pathway protease TraF